VAGGATFCGRRERRLGEYQGLIVGTQGL